MGSADMVTLSGGTKLEEALRKIADGLAKAHSVDIGFMAGATYPDGTSVALVAAIQEFGAPAAGQRTEAGKTRARGANAVAASLGQSPVGIPPRPFFRNMIAAKSGRWPKAVADLLKANNYDSAKTLALTGEAIKGQLQASIAEFSGVPLSPATVKKKGSDKQLVDTGHLLASVTYKVD